MTVLQLQPEHPQQHVLARHVPVPLRHAAKAQRLVKGVGAVHERRAGEADRPDLTWLISLVREFWVADGIENGLLLGGNIGGERLRG
ncbi:hypothetical protein ACFFGR_14270, partial [Arthrobacter liuii]|uniref:hypothetical protein n=1 Tax=Arthrobacter liuii TaxID=1476996 RepID=UPI0035E710BD